MLMRRLFALAVVAAFSGVVPGCCCCGIPGIGNPQPPPPIIVEGPQFDQGGRDGGKFIPPEPPKPDPFPKFEPPKFDPPVKKDPPVFKDPPPFKDPPVFKDPPKPAMEEVAWTLIPDGAPPPKSPAKAAAFLSFASIRTMVMPTTLSPFVAVQHGIGNNQGWQFFDLESCKLVGQILGKLDLDKPALSPDGKLLAGKASDGNFKQSTINVHSVPDGGKIVRSCTVDTDAASLRWIDFLEDNHTLTYKTHGLTAHFEIWSHAGQRVQHIQLKGLLDERERMCLSPSRRYLAIAEDGAIHIFLAVDGKKVGLLRPPIGFNTFNGMAFSPDGQELAVYGSMFGSSSQMVVYNMEKGTLTNHHKFAKDLGAMVKNRFGYKGQPFEWLPDKSGWLFYGQTIVDAVSGAPVHDIAWPPKEFSYYPRRFIGPDHVVSSINAAKGGTQMGYLSLPTDKIAQAVKQSRSVAVAAPTELPPVKNPNLATAVKLDNAGNTPWKVTPDAATTAKTPLSNQSIALRGSAATIQEIFFTSADVGQVCIVDAAQPNALNTRRQYRVDRYDLVKGTHLGTTDLFTQDAPAKGLPGPIKAGGPAKAAPFLATDASPGGTRFAASRLSEPERLDVWNVADGKHLVAFKPGVDKVEWCGFVDENRILTLAGGQLILWTVPDAKAEYIAEGYKRTPQFSVNRKQLLVMGAFALEMLDTATGQRLGQLEAPAGLIPSALHAAAFSSDGRELAASILFAGTGVQIVRWDMGSGAVKDRMDAKNSVPGAPLRWIDTKHVLAGNTLFNWDLKAAICSYSMAGLGMHASGSPDGRHWWASSTNNETPGVLAAQSMPGNSASDLAKQIASGQVKRAIALGAKFQVAINGFGATQNEIHNALTANLKNAGFVIGPGGVSLSISAQETATGKMLDYEIRKVGVIGLPTGPKQMARIAEKRIALQVNITDAGGMLLDKRDLNFSTPIALNFEGNNYQAELDRAMWNNAAAAVRSLQLPTNLYRVQGQLQVLPVQTPLKAGG